MQKPRSVSKPSRFTHRDAIVARARELGFDAIGFARADVPLDEDVARYEAFLSRGMHGDMRWLGENREVRARLDGDGILAGAKSVVCLARRYDRGRADEESDADTARMIARYARGQDYHNALRKKLRKVAAFVRTLEEGVEARPVCDDIPVLERAWAARAGLGFIGKNGLLIVPGQGSFVLLGEVVTTLSLEPDLPIADRCGACTRCIDACPTDALVEPRVLDARRCISYLTIEHRSAVPEPLRAKIGAHLFGCDDCQTVCPFNAEGPTRERTRPADLHVFSPHPRWADTPLGALVGATDAAFEELSRGSPLRRATRDGLARSAAIVAGNVKDESARPALLAAAEADSAPDVRDAARWALEALDAMDREKPGQT